jgi:ABC-type sugar transport system ATPase subunit
MNSILQARRIVKSFSGVQVLKEVDFELRKGEIHAIVGENGAGKSTLMKILMGEHIPDSGQIFVNGKQEYINTPRRALDLGIAMVQQEMHYLPYLSVADYIYLGREPRQFIFLNERKKRDLARKQLNSIGVEIEPNTKMRELSVSSIQMIEIAKAISYGSRILILDEPTSSLSEAEVDKLFRALKQLKMEGTSIIYISHRLEELYKIVDTVTILRDGAMVHTDSLSNLRREQIISFMVGRKIDEIFQEKNTRIGDVILSVKNLTKNGEFENVTFDVRKGEIVGLAGLIGAGRTEVATAIFGETKLEKGDIAINGKAVKFKSARQAVKHKIAFISEDRKLYGLNLVASVRDNILIVVQRRLSKFGLIKQSRSKKSANSMIDMLRIKVASSDQLAQSLSGGNQQKVVLAKWLLSEPNILIMDEPTKGIDVGAKVEVYRLINELAKAGKAIVLISSELPEILRLCNRVVVLRDGRVSGELAGKEITQESIMLMASG